VRVGHPSLRRLHRWLDGGEPKLDDHLATCERCANRIEEIESSDRLLRQPLLDLLAPPVHLNERLQGGIDERMRTREDMELLGELFGLPIRAARVMTSSAGGD